MSKLKIVPDKAQLEEGNNFWNCCPLQLKLMPTEHCEEGKPTFEKNKVIVEPNCAWWLNSTKDNYCFWKYIKRVSSADGSMLELSQSELARLLGWSNTKTHFILKEAMDELTKILKEQDFGTEFSEQDILDNLGSITQSIINNSTD
tara:strand:+ start:93562 stop:93999 length:438 start_codon:yes stop_codon:yes gene_type:complete